MRKDGYTNDETKMVSDWMRTSESANDRFRDWAIDAWIAAADAPPGRLENAAAILNNSLRRELETKRPMLDGVYTDLLVAALNKVDWAQLADELLSECREASELEGLDPVEF